MSDSQCVDNEQKSVWNGAGWQGWVKTQGLVDRTFKSMEEILTNAVQEADARRVLDVGCGTGTTTVAAAKRMPAETYCLGIDLSQVMIDAARTRADSERVAADFICADAQSHAFASAAFDMIISRFGIMFFNDSVQAFANLRSVAAAQAQLRCIAWRSPAENPFMIAAEQAAERHIPGISERTPDEPGQFGFANHKRVTDILTQAGWRDIDITELDVECVFPASELDLYLSHLGPVGRVLQEADDQFRTQVIDTVRPAFAGYVFGDEVRFSAACWQISASAGA